MKINKDNVKTFKKDPEIYVLNMDKTNTVKTNVNYAILSHKSPKATWDAVFLNFHNRNNKFQVVEFKDQSYTTVYDINEYSCEEDMTERVEYVHGVVVKFIGPDELDIREAKIIEKIGFIIDSMKTVVPRFNNPVHTDPVERIRIIEEQEERLDIITKQVDEMCKY